MTDSTAVTTTGEGSSAEVAQIQQAGRMEVQRRSAIREIYGQLQGIDWGRSLSQHTRAVLAAFCHDVGANVQYHVDNLGGKPYLNANYWSDKINGQLHFMGFEQVNISKDAEAREFWGVPEWATHAYVTEIRRFINAAPIEAIRAGQILDPTPWITTVRECNYAGGRPDTAGKKDPIGNAEPSKTARTRSLRRCACRAFEAIRIQNAELVEKAEKLMLAEWETEIQRQQALSARDNPRALPSGELVTAVRRSGDASNDWESVQVDPALVRQAKTTRVVAGDPRSQAQREEDERREREAAQLDALGLEGEVDGFPADIHEEPA